MTAAIRHKNIRLDARNYVGMGWFFLTLCTFHRAAYFRTDSTARWLLGVLQKEAARACFHLRAYCLMPDHLHVLLHGATPGTDLLGFVKELKHKTAFDFARRTRKRLWQTSFYDHILRGDEAPADVAWYIWLNPVRARLAEKAADYPYSGPRLPKGFPPPEVVWSPPGGDRS